LEITFCVHHTPFSLTQLTPYTLNGNMLIPSPSYNVNCKVLWCILISYLNSYHETFFIQNVQKKNFNYKVLKWIWYLHFTITFICWEIKCMIEFCPRKKKEYMIELSNSSHPSLHAKGISTSFLYFYKMLLYWTNAILPLGMPNLLNRVNKRLFKAMRTNHLSYIVLPSLCVIFK
jgi:hypothetical protein